MRRRRYVLLQFFSRFPVLVMHLVLYIIPLKHKQKNVTESQICRIRRSINAPSCMLAIIHANDTIIRMFVKEIKNFSHSMCKSLAWTLICSHRSPKHFCCHIFKRNVEFENLINYQASEKWPNEFFGGNYGQKHDIWGIGKWWYKKTGFGCLNAPVHLIDESV